MSAGERGTIFSEQMQCWIMDPDFVPTQADIAAARARTTIRDVDAFFMFEPETPRTVEQQVDLGEELIDRIYFWLTIPLIGRMVANLIGRRLDRLVDVLEEELPDDYYGEDEPE
jgi:hypothetical protein